MKTINLLSGVLLVTGIAAVSCMKNDVIPSASSLSFKIQATNKVQPVVRALSVAGNAEASTSTFEWDTCRMVVSKIELEAEEHHGKESGIAGNTMTAKDGGSGEHGGNSGEDGGGNSSDSSLVNFEWKGPKTIDLFNLSAVIGGVTIDSGIFNNFTIKIKSFKADAGTTPLFYLTGNFTNFSDTVKRIIVIINEDFELKIKNLDTLDLKHDFTNVIKVNLVQLMSTVTQTELDNADLTNGMLVINSKSNVTLYNKIKKNFNESEHCEFERD
jgi:hypothetical protein